MKIYPDEKQQASMVNSSIQIMMNFFFIKTSSGSVFFLVTVYFNNWVLGMTSVSASFNV